MVVQPKIYSVFGSTSFGVKLQHLRNNGERQTKKLELDGKTPIEKAITEGKRNHNARQP